jgi:hypothetical protein
MREHRIHVLRAALFQTQGQSMIHVIRLFAGLRDVTALNALPLTFFICGVCWQMLPTRHLFLKCQKMNEF